MNRSEKVAWVLAALAVGAVVFFALRKARGATVQNVVSGDVNVAPFVWPTPDPALFGQLVNGVGGVGEWVSAWNPCGCGCDGATPIGGSDFLPTSPGASAAQDDAQGARAVSQVMLYFSEVPNGTVH